MVEEGLISREEAVNRVVADQLDQLLHPIIDPQARAQPLCQGLPASPGAASGKAVFDPDAAERRNAKGEAVILVREETTPEDFHGIVAARAVLTARGGMTSHAAVVARGMGKCAVVGCKDIAIDPEKHTFRVDGTTVSEGDWITLDGATGRVFVGDLPTIPSEIVRVTNGSLPASRAPMYQSFSTVLGWANDVRRLRVRANADTPKDARVARQVRCGRHRVVPHRAHVLRGRSHHGDARDDRRAMSPGVRALAKLLPMQRLTSRESSR